MVLDSYGAAAQARVLLCVALCFCIDRFSGPAHSGAGEESGCTNHSHTAGSQGMRQDMTNEEKGYEEIQTRQRFRSPTKAPCSSFFLPSKQEDNKDKKEGITDSHL